MKIAVTAVVLSFAGLSGTASAEDCARKVGEHMPALKNTTDANGKAVTVGGSGWTFVTIGASWCKPCAKELPAWDGIAPNFSKLKWFAVDISEKLDDGKAFHDKLKLKNLSRAYTHESSIGNLGAVMPSSYVIDPNGIIRYERCGFEEEAVSKEVSDMSGALKKLVP